jgi:hypothetical protein
MSGDEKIDRLIDTLQHLLDGRGTVRRYWVEFGVYSGDRRARVVEAYSAEEAIQAASLLLHSRGHDPTFIRPALDSDCYACGHQSSLREDLSCVNCGRTREEQVECMRGKNKLR